MAGTTHGHGHSAVAYGCRGHFADGLVGDDHYVTGGWRGGSPSRCDPLRGQRDWAIALSVPELVVAVSEGGCASRRCIEKTGQFLLLEPVDKSPESGVLGSGHEPQTADVDGVVCDPKRGRRSSGSLASFLTRTKKSFPRLLLCAGRRVRRVDRIVSLRLNFNL